MLLKGLGSALSNSAVFPDLVHGIDDPPTAATLSGLWNAAYYAGSAAGPLIGGLLTLPKGSARLCTSIEEQESCKVADQAVEASQSTGGDTAPTVLFAYNPGWVNGQCSCQWKPHNGFDDFAMAVAGASAAFAVVVAVAIALNVRGPKPSACCAARLGLDSAAHL